MHKIGLVVNKLAGGGAERNIVRIAEFFEEIRKFDVYLIVLRKEERETVEITSRLKTIYVNDSTNKNKYSWIQARLSLRKIFVSHRFDAVVAFDLGVNVITLGASLGLKMPVIVSERNNPLIQRRSLISRVQERLLYPFAFKVVLLAEELEDVWAKKKFPRWKVTSIPNPLPIPKSPQQLKEPKRNDEKIILGLGRFVNQKGFDLLIRAFAEHTHKFPEWRLYLVGEGPEKKHLDFLAGDLGVKEKVVFCGWSTDPYIWFNQCDIFAFPSRYEGFGMTLGEALSCGVPCVSFNCQFGPSRILDDGINGYLVQQGEVEQFGKRLSELMGDNNLRDKMGAQGVRVLDKFKYKDIMLRWLSEVEEAVVTR